MIQEAAALLRGVKGLTFTISKEEGSEERLQVMITSSLGEAPKSMNEDIEQLRAVLAMPLVMRGTAAEIDQALPDLLARAAQVRSEVAAKVSGAVDALEQAAADASAKAKARADAASAKKAADAKKPGPKPKVPPTPVAPAKALAGVSEAEEKPGPVAQSLLFRDEENAGVAAAPEATEGEVS